MSDFKNSHKPLDEKGYLSTSLASIGTTPVRRPARSLQKPVLVVVILLLVVGFTFYR